MTEVVQQTARGAIVYDADRFADVSDALFAPGSWAAARPVGGVLRSAGRGNTLVLSDGTEEYVLRRYVRGGLAARVLRNAYLWSGADATRSFREWRLLRKLADRGLNVPQPAAARYRRYAMWYTADLLTVRIPGIRSLAERLIEAPGKPEFWQDLGVRIHDFHEQGVYHADMNAYNVQVDADDVLWLLDFDRGRLDLDGTWKQRTLARLHRSLRKIQGLSPAVHYGERDWQHFLDGYLKASRSA